MTVAWLIVYDHFESSARSITTVHFFVGTASVLSTTMESKARVALSLMRKEAELFAQPEPLVETDFRTAWASGGALAIIVSWA